MDTAFSEDELIDIRVRLPRHTIEQSLLSKRLAEEDSASRRLGDAKAMVAGRHRRAACFAGVRFYDPSWEMIIELYVAFKEARQLTVSHLCGLSGVSNTTALRHVEHLEALGYLERNVDAEDRRRARVMVLPPLVDGVEQWLDLQMVAEQVGC